MGQYYTPYIEKKDDSEKWNVFGSYLRVPGKEDEFIFLKLMEHSWYDNEWVNSIAWGLYKSPYRVAWVGDYADDTDDLGTRGDVYKRAYQTTARSRIEPVIRKEFNMIGRFLVNHDKKSYVDCDRYERECLSAIAKYGKSDSLDWVTHPLPLLTAAGNGQGGGDYNGMNEDFIGAWCMDIISIEDNVPDEYEEEKTVFVYGVKPEKI